MCTRRKEQRPHRRRSQPCLWVFRSLRWRCGSTVPAAGPGTLTAAVLGAAACWHRPFFRRSLLPLPKPGYREGTAPPVSRRLKIYWAWTCPPEQDPVFPTTSPSHPEASTSPLSSSIIGQTQWKPQSQITNQTDHVDHSLVQLSETVSRVMWAPKMDGLWWRVLPKRGPLEKGTANHFSLLAYRTPWTVWKEQNDHDVIHGIIKLPNLQKLTLPLQLIHLSKCRHHCHFVVEPRFLCLTHTEAKQTKMLEFEGEKSYCRAKQGECSKDLNPGWFLGQNSRGEGDCRVCGPPLIGWWEVTDCVQGISIISLPLHCSLGSAQPEVTVLHLGGAPSCCRRPVSDVTCYLPFEEEPGPCFIHTLIFLLLLLSFCIPLISNCLNLPFATQGRSWRLKQEMEDTARLYSAWEGPQGPRKFLHAPPWSQSLPQPLAAPLPP